MEFISPNSPISLATSTFFVLTISSLSWKFLGFNQNIIGLILSLIFSVIWMSEFKLKLLKKIFYIFLNGVLIFFTALGGNTIISQQDISQANITHSSWSGHGYGYSQRPPSKKNERSFFDSWINK